MTGVPVRIRGPTCLKCHIVLLLTSQPLPSFAVRRNTSVVAIVDATSNCDRGAGPFLCLVRSARGSQNSGAESKRNYKKSSREFNFHIYLPRIKVIRQNSHFGLGSR